MEKYKKALPGAKIGDSYIEGDMFEKGKYNITYINLQNGLIVYSFKRKKEQEQEEYETVLVKEEDYVYEPEIEADNSIVWKAIGVAVVVGTIAEDIVTLGTGITNDIPSIAWGVQLIFGS